jgi:hypothetical protein
MDSVVDFVIGSGSSAKAWRELAVVVLGGAVIYPPLRTSPTHQLHPSFAPASPQPRGAEGGNADQSMALVVVGEQGADSSRGYVGSLLKPFHFSTSFEVPRKLF